MPSDAEILTDIEREVRGIGTGVSVFRAEIRADLDARDKAFKELDAYVTSLEAAMKRSPIGNGATSAIETPESKAFNGYLRRGVEALDSYERKALAVGDDTAGGYLASSTLYNKVLARLREISPMRQVANVYPLGRGELTVPRRETGITARWVGELEDRTETQPSFGQLGIPAHEVAAIVEVTTKLLEDADFNIEQIIADEFADQLAQTEGEAFVIGNGVKKPNGFLTYTSGSGMSQVEQVASGNATELTPDAMIKALYRLKASYRANATWLMNGNTLAKVRLLKDSAGRYLWDQANGGIVAGQPETLIGRRVIEMPDVPDVAPGALAMAVGDLRRGYMVADRRGLTILRDPFSKAHQGIVRFVGSLRVGGAVVLGEALKIVKISA